MRAITLTEPWATLALTREKQIETRGFRPLCLAPGELVLIHAGKTPDPRALQQARIAAALSRHHITGFHHGAIVGAVKVIGWQRTDVLLALGDHYQDVNSVHRMQAAGWPVPLSDDERAFGNYATGRYGWLLTHPKRLTQPVPCRGQLGLWDVSDAVRQEVVRNFRGAGVELLP